MSASPLHELADLVFENADKMPDGVYKSILDGLMEIKQSREEDERVAELLQIVEWRREQWWEERQEAKKLREENEKLRDEFQRFRAGIQFLCDESPVISGAVSCVFGVRRPWVVRGGAVDTEPVEGHPELVRIKEPGHEMHGKVITDDEHQTVMVEDGHGGWMPRV